MWSRVRLDVGFDDLAFAALRCALPADREAAQARLEALWSGAGDALACHSVRSGFDLLLEALAWPRGDEILFSALNVKGMVKIAVRHGLAPVPVDLELATMGPRPDLVERAITPRTRAIVVAHLFGTRVDLGPIVEIARRHGLLVIEDCAQAFCGDGFRGHPDSDVTLFSFGPLKTATAFGGALVRVRDADLLARMREIQAGHPVQTRRSLFVRLAKFALLKTLTWPRVFGAVAGVFRLLDRDYEDPVADAVRGVARLGSAGKLRWRPNAAQLALLERRIRRFDEASIVRRRACGRSLRDRVVGLVRLPGDGSSRHDYWVFPILVDEPARVTAALRAEGFDASGLPRSQAIAAPDDRPKLEPVTAKEVLAKLVVLPCYAAMPPAELDRQAAVLADALSAGTPPSRRRGSRDRRARTP